ncbi:methyltransferase domain-containing [Paramuricea clavata]|uniref:Methyltransferase domain-containing n=1 Tax=Paramuricea clavata TaxID=317549 RepID=A0A6S7HGF4_PARCT|nr:methyltransferase domain-containing [Paramuricea clavata]
MEADKNAKSYDEVSSPQIEAGSQFIRELNLSLGDKVLDMGCGTGHLTKYIADIVGPDGQAVGIDPDAERIKIAEGKSKEVSNLQFCVGSSAIGFPHDNEPYYDVHISTHAFHWVPDDEKRVYIQKAHRCLKAGGKLAI